MFGSSNPYSQPGDTQITLSVRTLRSTDHYNGPVEQVARQPQVSATASRAASSADFDARAAACIPEGFANSEVRYGSIAARAEGNSGVEAA